MKRQGALFVGFFVHIGGKKVRRVEEQSLGMIGVDLLQQRAVFVVLSAVGTHMVIDAIFLKGSQAEELNDHPHRAVGMGERGRHGLGICPDRNLLPFSVDFFVALFFVLRSSKGTRLF